MLLPIVFACLPVSTALAHTALSAAAHRARVKECYRVDAVVTYGFKSNTALPGLQGVGVGPVPDPPGLAGVRSAPSADTVPMHVYYEEVLAAINETEQEEVKNLDRLDRLEQELRELKPWILERKTLLESWVFLTYRNGAEERTLSQYEEGDHEFIATHRTYDPRVIEEHVRYPLAAQLAEQLRARGVDAGTCEVVAGGRVDTTTRTTSLWDFDGSPMLHEGSPVRVVVNITVRPAAKESVDALKPHLAQAGLYADLQGALLPFHDSAARREAAVASALQGLRAVDVLRGDLVECSDPVAGAEQVVGFIVGKALHEILGRPEASEEDLAAARGYLAQLDADERSTVMDFVAHQLRHIVSWLADDPGRSQVWERVCAAVGPLLQEFLHAPLKATLAALQEQPAFAEHPLVSCLRDLVADTSLLETRSSRVLRHG